MKRIHLLGIVLAIIAGLGVVAEARLEGAPIIGQHLVLPGETLYCIGRGYGVQPVAIAQVNALAPTARLATGQILNIPAAPWSPVPPGPVCAPQFSSSGVSTAPSQPLTPTTSSGAIYVVRRGDNLWRIATRFGVTVSALRAGNNLRTTTIYPGQQLLIPGPAMQLAQTATQQELGASAPGTSSPPPASTDAPGPVPTDQATAIPQPTDTPQVNPTETSGPVPTDQATAIPQPTDTPQVVPTETSSPVPTDQPTAIPQPTNTPQVVSTATPGPAVDALSCAVINIAWSEAGQLLRGGRPEAGAFGCLAAAGVDVIIDQQEPSEADLNEPELARQAGIEYVNLGIPDDTAPSPAVLRAWVDTVNARLAEGKIVLVHDRAGRGRMGFWDAVYYMNKGTRVETAVEDRYLAKALPFTGAKIGCQDGGNGQVQALAEIGEILTGDIYYPSVDEYGTTWADCPMPAYMIGWDYSIIWP